MIATPNPRDHDPIVDPLATTNLNGAIVITAYTNDGQEQLWVVGDNHGTHGCACATCAPHDQIPPRA